jgi:ribonucleotide monophosphatase NagD (HAD superfamily)
MLEGMKARGLPLVCANPDIVVHAGEQLIWCAGALAERYAAIGGPVTLIGKPHPLIYEVARTEAALRRGALPLAGRSLAIGDGMFTDMAGAAREGYASLFISSGIHRDRLAVTDAGFDADAYAALVAEAGARPSAHMPALVW